MVAVPEAVVSGIVVGVAVPEVAVPELVVLARAVVDGLRMGHPRTEDRDSLALLAGQRIVVRGARPAQRSLAAQRNPVAQRSLDHNLVSAVASESALGPDDIAVPAHRILVRFLVRANRSEIPLPIRYSVGKMPALS